MSELLAEALPRIVLLAVTGGHAGLAELASLALQLAPQPHLAAPLAMELADFLGEGGREGPAIQLLETTIEAAERDTAVPAQDLLAMRWLLAWHVGEKTSGHGDPRRALEIARRVVQESEDFYVRPIGKHLPPRSPSHGRSAPPETCARRSPPPRKLRPQPLPRSAPMT